MVLPVSEENGIRSRRYAKQRGRERWVTTKWWLIRTAAQVGPGQRQAFAQLYQTYYPYVYAALLRQGAPPDMAADVAQDFFIKLMSSGDLARLDSNFGSFRGWLRAAGRNFLRNRRRVPQRRGGGVAHMPFDRGEAEKFAAPEPDPEQLLDCCRRELIVQRAYVRLQRRYTSPLHVQLVGDVYRALSGDERASTDAELAARFAKSELAIRQQRWRIVEVFRRLLLREQALFFPGCEFVWPLDRA